MLPGGNEPSRGALGDMMSSADDEKYAEAVEKC